MQRRNVTDTPLFVYNPGMVDPSMPWSLKGISDEAREFAKQAADESQVPVGAWVSGVIRSAAMQESGAGYIPTAAAQPAADTPAPTVQDTADRSGGSTIERAAQIVDDFGFEPEGPARDADLIEDPAQLQAELMALERRLDDSEATTRESLTPLTEEIDRVKSRLDSLKKH